MLFFILACRLDPEPPTIEPLDLAEVLSDDEVRAGVVTDEAALFGGISAEGRVGDIKLYNSRAQFIIQSVRPGSFYIEYGGGIIDADVVRPAGQPGRDVLDELHVMAGLGRLMDADSVTVISDGSDGGPAQVLAEGPGAPMTLLTGSLESDALVPDLDAWIATSYTLYPDSPLLLIETTLTWQDRAATIGLGDVAIIASDAVVPWGAGEGLGEQGPWPAAIGHRGEIAIAQFPETEPFVSSAIQDLLSSLGPTMAAFQSSVTVEEGDTLTWSRTLGVGHTLSELTDAWYARSGQDTVTISGTVTDGADGVPGARVHLLDDSGAPVLLAQTDRDGAFALQAPAGAGYTAVATGRGKAQHVDVAEGAGWYSPYSTPERKAEALESIASGAEPIPFAEGYGLSEAVEASEDTTLTLSPPGWVTVRTADGLPASIWLGFADGDPVTADTRLVPGRPSGLAAEGWLGADSLRLPVEPGRYTLTAHRGLRFEPYTESLSIVSGEGVEVTVTLEAAFDPGVPIADPHAHAAPSGDAEIPMSHRLLTHAANGVEVHFGTDHDHIADYRPLLAALSIQDSLTSIVADEVSPVLRGHLNVYPLSEIIGEPNNGALLWWQELSETPELFEHLRAQVGAGVIQLNHPFESGMLQAAGYNNGRVDSAQHWSEDFDAMEVINDGDYSESFAAYLDMTARGLSPTPVGVSDSHGYRGGVGANVTFLNTEGEPVTDDTLIKAMAAQATVISTGPYLEITSDGQWAPGQTYTGSVTLEVAVLTASWVSVDRLVLYVDGERGEEIAVTGASPERLRTTLTFDPTDDAVLVIVAESDSDNHTVYRNRSWAMAAAIRVDVDGDGWTPPLPAVVVE
jgi:hypothetical protein